MGNKIYVIIKTIGDQMTKKSRSCKHMYSKKKKNKKNTFISREAE